MTLLVSSRGTDATKLKHHDIKLLYSRCGPNNDRLAASIVAIRKGVIEAKIVSTIDGADKREALLALRRYVEVKLDRVLRKTSDVQIDSGSGMFGESYNRTDADAPPAYLNRRVESIDKKAG